MRLFQRKSRQVANVLGSAHLTKLCVPPSPTSLHANQLRQLQPVAFMSDVFTRDNCAHVGSRYAQSRSCRLPWEILQNWLNARHIKLVGQRRRELR
jgi:hypothetical protein